MKDTYTIQVGNKVIRVDRKTGRHEVVETRPLREGKWVHKKDGWFWVDNTRTNVLQSGA